MAFTDDIVNRIKNDFGESANEASRILTEAQSKYDYLKSDRIIRCIVFLAKGDLTDLSKYIDSAVTDLREVIFWAEYTGITESKTPKRIRDFTKTFEECSKNVRE